jgi:phosphoribosylformylglycinamidine cyclo-ligase
VFNWLAEVGQTPEEDLRRTYNLGIGMVAVVAPDAVAEVLSGLIASGEDAFPIGEVRAA